MLLRSRSPPVPRIPMRSCLLHLLSLTSQSVDLELDDIASGKVRESSRQGDAFGGACENQVPGLELEELAEVQHDLRGIEDHVAGRGVLPQLAVDPGAEAQAR